MDTPPETLPPEAASAQPPTGSRWMLPRLPVLIGVAGLGALVTTGSWFKRQSDVRQRAEVQAIQAEVSGLRKQATQYLERIENLRWNSAKIRAAAESTVDEPLKTWMRERAKKFEALVERIEQQTDAAKFDRAAEEIESQFRRGNIDAAREATLRLRPPSFPAPTEFRELQEEFYLKPLANYSRQNPAYYSALQMHEPDAAQQDIAFLRGQLASADLDAITPQSLVMFELLSAVTPPNDPVLADWSVMATAADYFENPDAATLKRWREAKQAMRLEDWPTAFARMQAINLTTVRTRQPYRAAYGRTILKNRPDQTAAAFPYMQEAAATGDTQARSWVAQEEVAHGRYAEAIPWLEASVAAGETAAVPQLLKLYAMDRKAVPRDLAREAGTLERIVVAPDAPPLASLLLGRLYEEGGGVAQSAEKAFACYSRAAASESLVEAWLHTARCQLRGIGTPRNFDQARDLAARAYASGEREQSVPMLFELMQEAPDRTASAVQDLLAHEQIASPSGFQDTRIGGPSVSKLRMQVARFLDQKGLFAAAARLYAQTGNADPAAARRHAELTAVLPCDACAGAGKVQVATACPTCVAKGTVTCSVCDGRGFNLTPGSPPCTICGGSGGMVQEGRTVTCSACSGTGKGKGSVVKKVCDQCAHGRATCRECVSGWIKVTKDCPECRGVGARALADK